MDSCEAVWTWAFVCWKIFDDSFNFRACGGSVKIFYFFLIEFWQPTRLPHPWDSPGKNTGVGCHFLHLRSPKRSLKHSVQFISVAQSCPTLCDPMNPSTPGLPVHHHHPEFTQTHIHRVSDAIQPSHPLSSPSPPDPNPSQHQSLCQ